MLDIEPLSLGEHERSSEMNSFFCYMIRSVIWRDGGEGSRLAEEVGEGGFAVVATG